MSQNSKLSIDNRKLRRLYDCKTLTKSDNHKINTIYEKRQYKMFVNGIIVPIISSLVINNFFLNDVTKFKKGPLLFGFFCVGHIFFKKKINNEFFDDLDPFFELYKIK